MLVSQLEMRSRRTLAGIAVVLLLSNVGLVVLLGTVALQPPSVVVTPLVADEEIVVPGDVPSEAVTRFVVHWLYHLDDWTIHTLKDRSNYVLRYTHHAFAQQALKTLKTRLRDAQAGNQASQIILPPPSEVALVRMGGTRFRATVEARLRDYITDRLAAERRVRYTIDVVVTRRSETNRYGFLVRGVKIDELPSPEEAGKEQSS